MNSSGRPDPRFSRHAAEWAVVAAAGLLIATVITAAWLSYRGYSAAEREFALRHADDVALVLQAHARNTLLGVDDAVRRLKQVFERDGMRTDVARFKQEFSSIADAIAVVSVADAEGRLILSNLPIPPGAGIADLAHFRAHVERDTGQPFVNKPILGRVSGKWSFHLTRRINKPDGSFGGVAIIAVDLSYWDRLLQEGHFGAAGAIALVGSDGTARAVFSRNPGDKQALLQADWTFLARATAEARGAGRAAAPLIGGATSGIWAYRETGDFPLLVAVSVDEKNVAARLDAVRAWYVGGAMAIVILTVLLTAGLLLFLARQRRHAAETARMAEAVRQSEERFRGAFDQAAVGMGLRLVGRRDLPWQQVNQKLCDFLGYTTEELLSLPVAVNNVPEEEALAAQMEHRLISGEVVTYSREKQYLHKNGELTWGQLTVTVLHYADGQPAQALIIVNDISERKRAELTVRQSEELYRQLFDANPLPVMIRDENSLDILAVNQAMVDKYGYTREQFSGMTAQQLQSHATRDDYLRQVAARPAGAVESARRTHVTRDGAELEVDVVTRPFEFNGRAARLIVINDVTAEVRGERAVRDSEQRLRTIAEHIDEGFALFDVNDQLVFFNEGYRRAMAGTNVDPQLGRTYEALVRMRVQTLFALGEIGDVEAVVQECLAFHRGPGLKTLERKRPDGGYQLLRETRTASGQTVISFIDITDLKRREADLRDSEQRFRAMFDYAGIGIAMRSALDRHSPWLAVNDKFCEMTGYSRAELLRMSTADITRPEGQAAAIADNRRLLAGEIGSYAREKQVICKDGSLLWVTLTVAMLRDAEGRPYRIIGTYQDINARKLAEDRLRESEGWYRAMIDYAGVGIATRPAHDRHLPWLAVNDKFCEMAGYSRDELLKLSTVDITVPEEQHNAVRDNQRLLAGEVSGFSREKQLIRKDGSRLWTAMSVTLLPDAEGRPYRLVAMYQDIHARKLAEARVRESEERLRAIIEAEPECVATVSPDGVLLDMNPAGLRMLGAASLDAVRHRSIIKYVAGGHRRAFAALHRRILSGRSDMLEFEAKGLSGKRIWMEIHAVPLHDSTGAITALLGIARDVTERRTAREALAAERNLLRTVIDNLPDRVRVRDRDMNILLANEAWRMVRAPHLSDVTGLSNREMPLAGRNIAEDHAVFATGRASSPREEMGGTSADPRWYVTTKTPLRDSAGDVIGVISISRDVTDIKRPSLEVEKLNAALEQRVAERTAQLTNANEELEAFAASVSHDLRAPLRHIDGLAAMLTEDHGGALDVDGQHVLGRIRAAASRMSQLIEDLLRLSRVARTELAVQEVDVSDLAHAIISELRRESPDRKVIVNINPDLRATADPGLLRTALVNLLQNAWKFTGNVADARIDVGSVQRRGIMAFYVRDNGAGFDMDRAERLFGAFQRLHADREFPGTGVGLATVRRVMRRHGGDAWAESAVGRGAIFFFTLTGAVMEQRTAREDAQPVPSSVPPAVANAAPSRASILLVDDDPDVLMLSARALRLDGYEVLTAGTGEEATVILCARAVGVIVSDFSMPGMNGAQLLAQAAALHPGTLRIIVSGQEMNRAMQAGLGKGEIHHYFGKQHSYDAVRACIRDWLMEAGQPGN